MLDLSPPFTEEVGEELCDTLENLFSLACTLSGPSRIPFFSLMVIKSYPEVLLPFSYVRNNFPRIQTTISDLRTIIQGCNNNTAPTSCYYQCLAEACSQYRRQLQSSFQGEICRQLEIHIVTCQRSNIVQKQVETALTTLDTENLKRIEILCISSSSIISLDDVGNSQSSATSSDNSANNSFTNTGLVEVINIEPDILCLQNIFSRWLVDSGTDTEHMHLLLPPMFDSNRPLTVKCDLHERILQPAQLPFYNQFTVHYDSAVMKMVFPSTSKAMGISIPIYKLNVTCLIPASAVCDSLVFGMPMIAQPTSCWKIDWEDLEKNQQLFKAFCQILLIKEQAAIAVLLPSDQNVSKTRNVNQRSVQPMGHFVLIPSGNGTLLVKSIAVQELVLPYNPGNQEEEVEEEYKDIVADSLDQLDVMNTYNPLNFSSNLFESLKKSMGKKPVANRQQKRSIEDSTTVYTNKMVTSKGNKQCKKATVIETSPQHDIDPADTPLGKRLLNKTKAAKRTLYTGAQNKFLPEEDVVSNESGNIQMFRSGRSNKTKPPLTFPTSL